MVSILEEVSFCSLKAFNWRPGLISRLDFKDFLALSSRDDCCLFSPTLVILPSGDILLLRNDDFDERMVFVVDSLEDTVSEEDIFHLSSIMTGPICLERKCE